MTDDAKPAESGTVYCDTSQGRIYIAVKTDASSAATYLLGSDAVAVGTRLLNLAAATPQTRPEEFLLEPTTFSIGEGREPNSSRLQLHFGSTIVSVEFETSQAKEVGQSLLALAVPRASPH